MSAEAPVPEPQEFNEPVAVNAEPALRDIFNVFEEGIYAIDHEFNLLGFRLEGLDGDLGGNFAFLAGRKCYEIFRDKDEPCMDCPVVEVLLPELAQQRRASGMQDQMKRIGRMWAAQVSPQYDEEGYVDAVEVCMNRPADHGAPEGCYRMSLDGPRTRLRAEIDPRPELYTLGKGKGNEIRIDTEGKCLALEIEAHAHWLRIWNRGRELVTYLDNERIEVDGFALLTRNGTVTAGPYEVEFVQQRVGRHAEGAPEELVDGMNWNARRHFIMDILWPEFEARFNIMDLQERGIGKDDIRRMALQAIREILDTIPHPLGEVDKDKLAEDCVAEFVGLGPLEGLLADKDCTEIMVNGADIVYTEHRGRLGLSKVRFLSNESLLRIIERIVSSKNRQINESVPYVDSRLDDGSRVHAIIPPLAIDYPILTIRKFPEKHLSVDDLINYGAINGDVAKFVQLAAEHKQNIIVSGGTGSGKTTFLNILSRNIPGHERILTVEDSAELRLQQHHVIRLEARPPNIEGTGAVPIRELVRNALRMRPDRIIVGECRGAEAFDMLQAMNTGHEGSMTTVHANSTYDAMARIESMCLMTGMELPVSVVRQQISSAVNIVIQLLRMVDGSRKCVEVAELTGLEQNRIVMAPIFRFKQTGMDHEHRVVGSHVATGSIPKFIQTLRTIGHDIDLSMFSPDDGDDEEEMFE